MRQRCLFRNVVSTQALDKFIHVLVDESLVGSALEVTGYLSYYICYTNVSHRRSLRTVILSLVIFPMLSGEIHRCTFGWSVVW